MCKNLALNNRNCVSLCLLDETLKSVGPFYPASVHTGQVNSQVSAASCKLMLLG